MILYIYRIYRSRDPGHAHVSETFVSDHVGTTSITRLSNLKFVPLAILDLLAFNAPKFTGSRYRDHAHFSETFVRDMSGLSLRTCLPNLKFVPSAVLEQTDTHTDRQTGTGLSETTAWLMVIAGHWTPDTRHHAQVILYSVQCCYAVHWTDSNLSYTC